MTNPELPRQEGKMPQGYDDQLEPPPPTFGDAVRYLWERRVRLAKFFLGLLALGVVGTLRWSTQRVRLAEATLSLGFKGIERGEYPSGRKFTIGDIRSPKVLQKAIKEIGKEKSFPAVDIVARGIQVQLVSHQIVAGPGEPDGPGLLKSCET